MPLQFTKEEVEEGLAGTLGSKVTRADIAKGSGLSESYIKRQFNSNDAQDTAAFQTLKIGCAIRDKDAEAGERFWAKFQSFIDLSEKRSLEAECEADPFNCLSKKLTLDGKLGSYLLDALRDGKLDRKEILYLQNLINEHRKMLDGFDAMLGFALQGTEEEVSHKLRKVA